MLFHKVDGAAAVLRSKGIFKQVDVYRRGNDLFAKWGSGFISLRPRNGTSLPDVAWEVVDGVQYKEAATGPLTLKYPALQAAE